MKKYKIIHIESGNNPLKGDICYMQGCIESYGILKKILTDGTYIVDVPNGEQKTFNAVADYVYVVETKSFLKEDDWELTDKNQLCCGINKFGNKICYTTDSKLLNVKRIPEGFLQLILKKLNNQDVLPEIVGESLLLSTSLIDVENKPDIEVKYLKSEFDQILLDVMNLGMSLRQNQLNGTSNESGVEVLNKWKEENL